jgi:F0F1-type ATP synthase membrane subunit c/vacuolar-type H+-ATPase subunit K
MIETKEETAELFERLEREFTDERHVLDEMERNLHEVEQLVPKEIAPSPSRTKRVVAGILAGLAIAVAGVGVGMAIQYYGETQAAQDQVATLQSQVAYLDSMAVYNAPSADQQLAATQAEWTLKGERAGTMALAPLTLSRPPVAPILNEAEWQLKADRAAFLAAQATA